MLDGSGSPRPYVWASHDDQANANKNGRDPQTIVAYGEPHERNLALLLFQFGTLTIGSLIRSFRLTQKAGQLTEVEAFSMIAQTVTSYAELFGWYSPEVMAACVGADAWAADLGFSSFHRAETEEETFDPDKREACRAYGLAIGIAHEQYEARLLRECGEEEMAALLEREEPTYRMIEREGEKSLYFQSGMLNTTVDRNGVHRVRGLTDEDREALMTEMARQAARS